MVELARGLQELHECWKPLPWQIPLGEALFYKGTKELGAQCGRSAGKTDCLGYANWRWGFENPGSENYIIEPLFNQAREILWASHRIQRFGPQSWIHSVNNTECRITFKNGSFIKLEGSDRPEKLRGIKPKGLICWDEVKDARSESILAMDPNRARYNVPALYFGTPPDHHNHYIDIMDRLKADKDAFWCRASSYDNPYNSREWLDRKKTQLIEMDLEDEWLREYEAIFIKGGKNSVFPWIRGTQFPSFSEIEPKDLNQHTLIVSFDPAASSIFAVVFGLYNPYTKRVIIFDEIYESDPMKMTARKIRHAVDEKLERFKGKVRDIKFVYDEAAKYFQSEIYDIDGCDWWLVPSQKHSVGGIDGYISITRSVMTHNLLTICSECPKLIWEYENYVKDDSGRIPDRDDHGINATSYLLHELGFNLDETKPPTVPERDLMRRAYRPDEDELLSHSYEEIA